MRFLSTLAPPRSSSTGLTISQHMTVAHVNVDHSSLLTSDRPCGTVGSDGGFALRLHLDSTEVLGRMNHFL